jgi:hypothetical protein
MARKFNSSTDKVEVIMTIPTGPMTIAGWAMATGASPPRTYQQLFGDPVNLGVYYFGTIFPIVLSVVAGSGTFNSAAVINSNIWYHIAITTNGTTVQTSFINGLTAGTGNSGWMPAGSSKTFWIGFATGQALQGNMADTALWNVVLSATEIAALAKGIRPSQVRPAALIGYWPLDGLQSPEPDLSGNRYNGTLTGTALVFGPPTNLITPKRRTQFIPVPPPPLMGQICL